MKKKTWKMVAEVLAEKLEASGKPDESIAHEDEIAELRQELALKQNAIDDLHEFISKLQAELHEAKKPKAPDLKPRVAVPRAGVNPPDAWQRGEDGR